ncbi:MAG: hypothetical protein RTV41_13660 [Candidatus Thorarchaeota archaeon]
MSESADCPYCGQTVQTRKEVDYDNKIKLRCNSCGGLFEYMPGFGSFTLPDKDQRDSVQYHGSTDYSEYSDPSIYDADAPWTVERPQSEVGAFNKLCAIICILCFILPIATIIVFFFSILDLILG